MTGRFRIAHFERRDIDGERCELRGAGTALVVESRLAVRIARWHAFGTPAELMVRLGPDLSVSERERAHAIMDRMLACGLLVGEDVVRARAAHDAGPSCMPAISSLVVLTRAAHLDDFAVLLRGLDGHRRARSESGGDHAITVFDDTRDPALSRAGRELVARLDPTIGWSGPAERRALVDALVAELGPQGVAPELVRFAVLGAGEIDFTAGANRNAALLAHVGERIASVDDDAVARISAIPETTAQLRLSSMPDPTDIWCFDARDDVLAATRADRRDVVECHEALLGRTLGECARIHGEPLDLDDMSPRFTSRVLAGRTRVVATYVGVAGDSGMGSPTFALLQRGASRARLMAAPHTYATALRTREVVRGVTSPTLVDSGFFMGMAIALDHRELLPPFLPAGRGEEHVFGAVSVAAFDDAVIGCSPFAMLHAPRHRREFTAADLRFDETRLADLVRACIHGFVTPPSPVDRRDGLRALGEHLVALGTLAPAEFEAELRARRRVVARDTARYLEVLLRRHARTPEPWARDVERYVASCAATLCDDTPVVARELAATDADVGRRLTQASIIRYGRLLSVWPEIVDAARVVRARGRQLHEPPRQ